jgi:hypothetical protein
MAASNDEPFVADGIFAVPLRSVPTAKQGRTPLVASVELLQVVNPEAANRCRGGVQDIATGTSSVCYLLAADVRKALGLHGAHSHLFDLLCAHARHEHPDRHLATHCATLHRKEEGYVLINGHPGFLDAVAMTAMINEPAAKASACLKMITGYTRLLADDHPLMVHAGLGQPPGAREAWEATVLPPEGGEAPPGYSERMVLYASTRKAYGLQQELTVDYGKSYMRNYASGLHRPSCKELTPAPPERLSAAQLLRPHLDVWALLRVILASFLGAFRHRVSAHRKALRQQLLIVATAKRPLDARHELSARLHDAARHLLAHLGGAPERVEAGRVATA